jgi:hypothetical protein
MNSEFIAVLIVGLTYKEVVYEIPIAKDVALEDRGVFPEIGFDTQAVYRVGHEEIDTHPTEYLANESVDFVRDIFTDQDIYGRIIQVADVATHIQEIRPVEIAWAKAEITKVFKYLGIQGKPRVMLVLSTN